jgi:hypothetical protein
VPGSFSATGRRTRVISRGRREPIHGGFSKTSMFSKPRKMTLARRPPDRPGRVIESVRPASDEILASPQLEPATNLQPGGNGVRQRQLLARSNQEPCQAEFLAARPATQLALTTLWLELRMRRSGPEGPQVVVREGFFRGIENMDVFEKPPWMGSRRPRKKPSRTAAYRQGRSRHRSDEALLAEQGQFSRRRWRG